MVSAIPFIRKWQKKLCAVSHKSIQQHVGEQGQPRKNPAPPIAHCVGPFYPLQNIGNQKHTDDAEQNGMAVPPVDAQHFKLVLKKVKRHIEVGDGGDGSAEDGPFAPDFFA